MATKRTPTENPFRLGFDARLRNDLVTQNPYQPGSGDHQSWKDGFYACSQHGRTEPPGEPVSVTRDATAHSETGLTVISETGITVIEESFLPEEPAAEDAPKPIAFQMPKRA